MFPNAGITAKIGGEYYSCPHAINTHRRFHKYSAHHRQPLHICLLSICGKVCLGLVISIVMHRLTKRQLLFVLYMQETTARETSKRVSV